MTAVPTVRGATEMRHGATLCRVCGWDFEEDPWADGAPQYLICDCCGAESGIEDLNPRAAERHLVWWIDEGVPWSDARARPADWDHEALRHQLARIGRDLDTLAAMPVPKRRRRPPGR